MARGQERRRRSGRQRRRSACDAGAGRGGAWAGAASLPLLPGAQAALSDACANTIAGTAALALPAAQMLQIVQLRCAAGCPRNSSGHRCPRTLWGLDEQARVGLASVHTGLAAHRPSPGSGDGQQSSDGVQIRAQPASWAHKRQVEGFGHHAGSHGGLRFPPPCHSFATSRRIPAVTNPLCWQDRAARWSAKRLQTSRGPKPVSKRYSAFTKALPASTESL